MRLLIAEDEHDLLRALSTIFEKSNYCVDTVDNGISAYEYGSSRNYDGIILDIMMPGIDGIEVLTRLRKDGITTPVLLLTAKSETCDKVEGLDAGADDYLAKPFEITELLARVRAMLRRKGDFQPDLLTFHDLTLNKSTYELSTANKTLRLVSREFQVLEMLMEQPGQVIPTTNLMEHIWGWDSDVNVNIVWVIISNLRKAFVSLKTSVKIKALRGVGYYLESKND